MSQPRLKANKQSIENCTVQWQAWLRHTRPTTPTIAEIIAADKKRLLIIERAKKLDEEWEQVQFSRYNSNINMSCHIIIISVYSENWSSKRKIPCFSKVACYVFPGLTPLSLTNLHLHALAEDKMPKIGQHDFEPSSWSPSARER